MSIAISSKPQQSHSPARETAHRFLTNDGTDLFYRRWQSEPNIRHAVILLHRGQEHSGRLRELAESIAKNQICVFAWDARGHGHSAGQRNATDEFAVLIRDLEWFVRHVCNESGLTRSDIAFVGHGVGGTILSTWVHDYAPVIRAMILAAPAFEICDKSSLTTRTLARIRGVSPNIRIGGNDPASLLVHDAEQAEAYRCDDLISPNLSARLLADMETTARRVIDDGGAIHTPMLLMSAGDDKIVSNHPQLEFFEAVSSSSKTHITLRDQRHALFHDTQRSIAIDHVTEFLVDAFAKPAAKIEFRQRGRGRLYVRRVPKALSASPLVLLETSRFCGAKNDACDRWSPKPGRANRVANRI